MKKTNFIAVLFCLTTSFGVVVGLFFLSSTLTQKHNSFLRLFPPHPIFERDTLNVKYNSYYIAGASSQTTYLGNHVAPFHLLVIRHNINDKSCDTLHYKITVNTADDISFQSLTLKVDSPYFFLSDGTLPAIFKGEVSDWVARKLSDFDKAYFTDAIAGSPSSFFIRSLSSVTDQYILGKQSAYKDEPQLFFKNDLLTKQIDGKFCVDGSMKYNTEWSRLIYTYYYRNRFLVMDSALNLLYEGKTIDTVSHAQIEIASVSDGKKQIMSAPPLMVNKRSCTSGNWLLIHSGLLAKNEDPDTFRKASVIDVYDINGGQYQFSFYIHDFLGERMKYFVVKGARLIVLFERHLVEYRITPKYLDMKNSYLTIN